MSKPTYRQLEIELEQHRRAVNASESTRAALEMAKEIIELRTAMRDFDGVLVLNERYHIVQRKLDRLGSCAVMIMHVSLANTRDAKAGRAYLDAITASTTLVKLLAEYVESVRDFEVWQGSPLFTEEPDIQENRRLRDTTAQFAGVITDATNGAIRWDDYLAYLRGLGNTEWDAIRKSLDRLKLKSISRHEGDTNPVLDYLASELVKARGTSPFETDPQRLLVIKGRLMVKKDRSVLETEALSYLGNNVGKRVEAIQTAIRRRMKKELADINVNVGGIPLSAGSK